MRQDVHDRELDVDAPAVVLARAHGQDRRLVPAPRRALRNLFRTMPMPAAQAQHAIAPRPAQESVERDDRGQHEGEGSTHMGNTIGT